MNMPEHTQSAAQELKIHHSYKSILLVLGLVTVFQMIVHIASVFFWSTDIAVNRLIHLSAALVLGGILIVFIKWIYFPLTKIEYALHVFETYGEDFSVSIDKYSRIYPIAHSLNRIHSHMQESIDREYKAHMKQKDAEIHALQNQINPHFLYNTLDAIRSLALINNDEQVADMTEALSSFFRYSIGEKGHVVTLREELENIDSYLAIQKSRFQSKVSYQVVIEGNREEVLSCQIPKLLLQPIIENAVYHGIEPKVGPGRIVLRIFTIETSLIIHVQDNGIGMDEEELQLIRQKLRQAKYTDESMASHSSGIALTNINQRILLNYGEEYGIRVASTKGVGSEVELRIPMIHEHQKGAI